MTSHQTLRNCHKALSLLAPLMLLGACGGGDSSMNVSDGQGGLAIPGAVQVQSLPANGSLNAYIRVDGGTRHAMSINGNAVQLRLTSLTPGTHTFTIEFEFNSDSFGAVLLATADKQLTLSQGDNNLAFLDSDYFFPDNDADRYSNIAELKADRDPNDHSETPVQSFVLFIADKNVDNKRELFMADPRTNDVIALSGTLDGSEDVAYYSVSPDQRYVAYTLTRSGANPIRVFISSLEDGSTVEVSNIQIGGTTSAFASIMTWAPDGSHIAFFARHDVASVRDVYTARPTGANNALKVSNNTASGLNILAHHPIWAPDSSRIAFSAEHTTDGLLNVYTALPVGADNAIKVSNNGTSTHLPPPLELAWSPNSAYLAFLAEHTTSKVFDSYIAPADTANSAVEVSNSTATGTLIDAYGLSWAPDGSRIAFTAEHSIDEIYDVYTAVADTANNAVKVSNNTIAGSETDPSSDPVWAPNGSRIAYAAMHTTDGAFDIFTASPTTADNAIKVSSNTASGAFLEATPPRWSPDSARIAYSAEHFTDNVLDIYTAAVDSADNAVKVSNNTASGTDVLTSEPVWSPDGSRIAYKAEHRTNGFFDIFTAQPDTANNAITVSNNGATGTDLFASAPEWSPDGSRLAFYAEHDTDTVYDVYTAAPTSAGNATKASNNHNGGASALAEDIDWAPDGSNVVYLAEHDTDGVFEIYIAQADGANARKLSGALVSGGDASDPGFRAFQPEQEFNDDAAHAQVLPYPITVNGEVSASSDPSDYFSREVARGSSFHVILSGIDSGNNLDLVIFDDQGTQIAESAATSGYSETAFVKNVNSNRIIIQVKAVQTGAVQDYRLILPQP